MENATHLLPPMARKVLVPLYAECVHGYVLPHGMPSPSIGIVMPTSAAWCSFATLGRTDPDEATTTCQWMSKAKQLAVVNITSCRWRGSSELNLRTSMFI